MLKVVVTAKGKKQLDDAMLKACRDIADRIYSEAQFNLTGRTWVGMGHDGTYSSHITDTGELAASGNVEPTKSGAKVIYTSPYASHVEYGVHPGGYGPPAEVIAKWCQRKLGLKKEEALSAAWAIKHKIAAEGTTARPFLRDAMYTAIAKYKNKTVEAKQ